MRNTCPLLALLFACAPLLGGCSSGHDQHGGLAGTINQSITQAMDRAQSKLRTEAIDVSRDDPKLPRAKITPQGDFLLDGKAVAITPAQREALLGYRRQLVEIAAQGIAIGKQGAALGLNAAGSALAAALSGKSEADIRKDVEAQAGGIRKAATQICARLPDMLAEQDKLAAILPAFKPYATMTQKDIDDCRRDASQKHDG